jgi:DNA polymerase II small subunit/DNA polymerase delta subunit B
MLSKDFKEFIESLNANRVRYLVVGGYAVALHGYPRYTKDLDVWIEPTAQNAQNVLNALTEFGFGSIDINTGDFL